MTDLYLLGAGISFPDHLTVQALDALAACHYIYSNLPDERLDRLTPELRAKTVTLASLYQDGRLRRDNYGDVVAAVLKGAEARRPIAWLTPGHPLLFDSVSAGLLAQGRARGWRVEVAPGISCIDTLLAEVEYEAANGLLVHEASAVVRRKIPLSSAVAVMLLQPSVFLSERAHLSPENRAIDLRPLRDYLLGFYPPAHVCAFVRSAAHAGVVARVAWTPIAELDRVPYETFAGATLFIPRISA